jgi:hypothetical protein
LTGRKFELHFPESIIDQLKELKAFDEVRSKKVTKALERLAANPRHPSLQSHPFQGKKGMGPAGEAVMISYIENKTPAAWRIYWYYAADERGVIGILYIGPHE